MRAQDVTGEDTGDLSPFVESHIEQEAGADAQGNLPQFFPKRVSIDLSKGGIRVAYVFRAMIAHDGLQASRPGHDSFDASAETGKEVRLNEAGNHSNIGFD